MARDQRKAVRRRVECRAALAPSEQAPRQDCIVCDMSHTGARILIDSTVELPSEFLLLLSRNVTRRCTLVWRRERQAGVRFRAPSKVDRI
jgi:PilZ domain